jgi:Carboxypeptidase regulatory-like domain
MRFMLAAACFVLTGYAAFAQTDRGTITGTIKDPAGAVVPGVAIEIRNQATGTVYSGGTSQTGNYVVGNLPAGDYALSVTAAGFKKFVRQNITVEVATDTRVDVDLEVGSAAETVTVTESAPLLKTESGELSHVVTTNDADQLPVFTIGTLGLGNGLRDPLQMAILLPGVQYSQDTVLQINGLPSGSEAIRVEGQDATNGLWNQWSSLTQAGVDAIQEVSIQTSNFAAEYGQAAGGYFNYTMKSGTNQLHGSLYDYMRNEALNAGEPYTDRCVTNSLQCGQHVRPRIREHDWGFTIGGPISIPKVYDGKNKSFFFFNWEQFLLNTETTGALYTVPTANYRAGNFGAPFVNAAGVTTAIGTTPTCTVISAACPTIGGLTYATENGVIARDGLGALIPEYGVYDPATAMQTPTGIVNSLFPNGIIPPTRMDPLALKIQNLLPLPNVNNLINNYLVPNYNNPNHTRNLSFKIDQSLSPTKKISGYFAQLHETNPEYNGLDLAGSVPASNAITGVEPVNTTADTVRLNYDETLRPTLLLHLGAGYIHTFYPYASTNSGVLPATSLGFYNNNFPDITGLNNTATGGNSVGLGTGASFGNEYEEKTTGNASLTWVKRNHTFKFGGELGIDGLITQSTFRANGILNFSANETSDQWQGAQPVTLLNTSGFGYASFLLGGVDNFSVAPAGAIKLGNHSISGYAQDSWKVTRTLTLDYGLRYDFQTYLSEEHGRMLNADFNQPNPNVGGYLGTVIFEGNGPNRCNCVFSHNYPYAWGPRLGIAYQINRKTVLRGGAGVQYFTASNNSQLSLNVVAFNQINAPGYGLPAMQLSAGNPYAAGNPFGNPTLSFPNFNPYQYPIRTASYLCPGLPSGAACYPPSTPFLTFDRSARPPRIFTWSLGIQRELSRSVVVEAEYVGNRAAWIMAPTLDIIPNNALNITDLAHFGLNINNAADRTLLASTLNSTTAIQRGFGTPPYPGFPVTQLVETSLRPHPQWGGVPPFLGPPLGDSWYDSLQAKVTKRFSHGLQAQGSYTYSKNLVLGANNNSTYAAGALGSEPVTTDIYNTDLNKQLSSYSRPNQLVFSGTYVLPKPWFTDNKIVSQVLKDWQIGAVLRYQSGALLGVPSSLNGIETELDRSGGSGAFNGGTNLWNLANGDQGLFLVNPNSHFDPTKQLVLNPAAWTDSPAGTFTTSSPYYNNYRWQRQPAEAMNFARNFRMGKEGKYNLNVRIDFQNVFNRHFFSTPAGTTGSLTYPSTPQANLGSYVYGGPAAGALSGGYGFVSFANGLGDTPRSGQAVARFTF